MKKLFIVMMLLLAGVLSADIFYSHLKPNATDYLDIGTGALRWNLLEVNDVNMFGTLTGASGNISMWTDDVGYLLADGSVDLTEDWTISANSITLTAGTLTANTFTDGTLSITGGEIIAGASNLNIKSGGSDIKIRAYEDATHYVQLWWSKTGDYGVVQSVGGELILISATGEIVLGIDDNLSGTGNLDFGAITGTSITDSGLTITRVPYASTAGLLVDSANLTFDGTTLTAGGFSTAGDLAAKTATFTLGATDAFTVDGETNPYDTVGGTKIRIANSAAFTGTPASAGVYEGRDTTILVDDSLSYSGSSRSATFIGEKFAVYFEGDWEHTGGLSSTRGPDIYGVDTDTRTTDDSTFTSDGQNLTVDVTGARYIVYNSSNWVETANQLVGNYYGGRFEIGSFTAPDTTGDITLNYTGGKFDGTAPTPNVISGTLTENSVGGEFTAGSGTNNTGILINAISSAETLNIGLDIGNISGSTTNYAIRTGTGDVYFGGDVGIGTTPTVALDVAADANVYGTLDVNDVTVNGAATYTGWFDDGTNFRVTVVNGIITAVDNSTAGGHNP